MIEQLLPLALRETLIPVARVTRVQNRSGLRWNGHGQSCEWDDRKSQLRGFLCNKLFCAIQRLHLSFPSKTM